MRVRKTTRIEPRTRRLLKKRYPRMSLGQIIDLVVRRRWPEAF